MPTIADISLDTEATGLDVRHGAQPYLVTICKRNKEQLYWEWDVDRKTRKVIVDRTDLADIKLQIRKARRIILQNAKFDVAALNTIDPWFGTHWPWEKTYDTLLAGHLLGSNQPHDLTSMALLYLGEDIQPLEDAVKDATKHVRRLALNDGLGWKIAKAGLKEMPSVKGDPWKYDMWIPRQFAEAHGFDEEHAWRTVCSEYANGDSGVTLPLFLEQEKQLKARGLWKIYEARLKLLPIVYRMEENGITLNEKWWHVLYEEYVTTSKDCAKQCEDIADVFGYDLELPKNGVNNSLKTFMFGETCETCSGTGLLSDAGGQSSCHECDGRGRLGYLCLPYLTTSKKTGEPSLSRESLNLQRDHLTEEDDGYQFITALLDKRKRDTALSYMDGYRRYWINTIFDDWRRMFPSLNPTGSDTLRWSSQNPNEQNISKQDGFNLRYMFGPCPDREWWALDAQNIELRIPAYESGETVMIELFERPNDPPYYGSNHLLNFHIVYPDIWDKVLAEVGIERVGPECKDRFKATWYRYCKNGGFCKQYGGQKAITDRTFRRKGAFELLEKRFSGLTELNNRMVDFANRNGYVETIPDKSVDPDRGYPLMCARGGGRVLPTVPLNYHVQGTAMGWMGKAMIRCHEYLSTIPGDYRMIMQVHDELVFDFPRGKSYRTNLPKIRTIQRLMEKGGDDIGIPTPVSISYHPVRWSEEQCLN